jgi:hypothetical protein
VFDDLIFARFTAVAGVIRVPGGTGSAMFVRIVM